MRTRNIFRSSVILAGVIFILQLPLSAGQKTISYQGKLTNASGAPITSSSPMTVTFKLYNSSGTQVWAESQGVTFSSGLFNVTLGKGTSLDGLSFSEQYSLGIQLAGDTTEMTPRQPLSASSYALGSLGDFNVKQNLNSLNLYIAGNTVLCGVQISSNTNVTGKVTMTNVDISSNTNIVGNTTIMGKVGIGTKSPDRQLDIDASGTLGLRIKSRLSGSAAYLYLENDLGNFGRLCFTGSATSGDPNSLEILNGNTGITINQTGNIGIGTNAPDRRLDIDATGTLGLRVKSTTAMSAAYFYLENDIGNYGRMCFNGSGTGASANKLEILNGSKGITIDASGNLYCGAAFKPGGGSWSDSSDSRLKKNIETLKDPLATILKLRGVNYEWQEPEKHGDLTGRQMGFIAQEVENVFPEWVGTGKDGFKFLTVRGFEALTVESIRELKKENEVLETKIDDQQKQINELRSEINKINRK
jgi:hypothetical protein